MRIQTHSILGAAALCVSVALSQRPVVADEPPDAELSGVPRSAPVKLRDGDRLQLTMYFQAALRAAESELAELDDAERARRIRAIASSVQDPDGTVAGASRPIRESLPPSNASRDGADDSREVVDGQAEYVAAVARLRETWPANPTPEDYARLEGLKEKYVRED